MPTAESLELTIDQLATATGTTSRRIRSFQTLGLLPHPALRGRTGVYGVAHRDRVAAILRLQDRGFSLESLGILFAALEAGLSLGSVLGESAPADHGTPADRDLDTAELYGFAELQHRAAALGRRTRGRLVLSVVPTTVWDMGAAS